jgi:hypothetical protein
MTDNVCGRPKRDGSGDECGLPAGWGTEHVGDGACKLHGGATPRGRDSPNFKHGLFSDYLDEEDRATIDALNDVPDADKLDSLINWRLARLRRAVESLNDDADQRTFWDAFDSLVSKTDDPDADEIKQLAGMLSQGNRAMQDEIDLVRKLIKDRNKIAEGEDHNITLTDVLLDNE